MTLSNIILRWADRLRDMSAMGLRYSENCYDRSRYTALQDLSIEMQALVTGELPEALEPLRLPVFSRPTPLTCADAAVIDGGGRILLIRRADTRDWAMPGGALEVGESPAEGAVREAFEETGVRCQPLALVGVFDSNRCGAVSRFQLHITQFLCAPLAPPDGASVEAEPPPAAVIGYAKFLPLPDATATPGEVLEIAWFPEHALPPDLHIGHALRIREAYRVYHGDPRPYFDPPQMD